jgi:hypothetical protein
MYRMLLDEFEPTRKLYLAVSDEVYSGILKEPLGQLVITKLKMNDLVVDVNRQRIMQWIS